MELLLRLLRRSMDSSRISKTLLKYSLLRKARLIAKMSIWRVDLCNNRVMLTHKASIISWVSNSKVRILKLLVTSPYVTKEAVFILEWANLSKAHLARISTKLGNSLRPMSFQREIRFTKLKNKTGQKRYKAWECQEVLTQESLLQISAHISSNTSKSRSKPISKRTKYWCKRNLQHSKTTKLN